MKRVSVGNVTAMIYMFSVAPNAGSIGKARMLHLEHLLELYSTKIISAVLEKDISKS